MTGDLPSVRTGSGASPLIPHGSGAPPLIPHGSGTSLASLVTPQPRSARVYQHGEKG